MESCENWVRERIIACPHSIVVLGIGFEACLGSSVCGLHVLPLTDTKS